MSERLRIGILGAARVTGQALVQPAKNVPEVELHAIAARSKDRAAAQAKKYSIGKVHDSYSALLADPAIDAVYIPLPNSLHCEWSIKALEAGKHVLCEKPIANNEAEAQQMADVAKAKGLVLAEAMHSRYHALPDRVAEILESGVLGAIKHVEARACFIIANGKDIRWQYEMGGGALMDLGVYAVAVMRSLARTEPEEVTSVEVKLAKPNVDRWVDARFRFPGGVTGRVRTSMWGFPILEGVASVEGSDGRLTIINPYGPQLFNRLDLEQGGKTTRERVPKLPGTYDGQLRAFVDAVQNGSPIRTGPSHFIPNMHTIDAIYRKAGLPPRGTPV